MARRYVPTVPLQEAMAGHLIDSVIRDATGEADGDRCVGEPPSAHYYLATLAPQDVDLAASQHRRGRATPRSAGFEFEVSRADADLSVSASVSCYYRVLPSLAEQLAYLGADEAAADRAGRQYRLAPVFRRLEVATGPLAVRLDPSRPIRDDVGIAEFTSGFAAARQAAAADPAIDRRPGEDRADRRVPGEALASEEAFRAYLQGLAGAAVMPAWAARITVAARPVRDGRTRVSVQIENLSLDPVVTVNRRGQEGKRHDDSRDHFLFRVRLEVSGAPGVLQPIRMDLGPDAYRYDPDLAAYATNCGIEASEDGTRIWSVPAPVHVTRRTPSTPHEATSFARLEEDPLPLLDGFAKDLRAYADDPSWGKPALPPPLAKRKARDRAAFTKEIERFEDGLRWLRKDKRLLLAFRLANRSMIALNRATGMGHSAWHRFQLVFIVSQLPALAWREYPEGEFTPGLWGSDVGRDPTEAATVVWYPTGGGKTEAYLGLIACALFYDRARGKERGMTAWCRFPLRLLTLQQSQRQLELIVAADGIRAAAAEDLRGVGGGPGEQFSLGFFAGEGNTPNALTREGVLERLIADPERRREVQVVDECPWCRSKTVELLPPDPVELRLIHACSTCKRQLPLFIVDSELYRYLPSVIVGTLDKLAMIGLSDKFGALLGDVECECSLHGLGRGAKCHERRAKGHPKDTIRPLSKPLYDPSPSLEIIDELHMVREELGAFSGHYEGILSVSQRRLSAMSRGDRRPVRMKVVATTATIRGEDRQCEHLFGLRSIVVPQPGPSLQGSFYWKRDEGRPLRRFVGILPHRATAEMALVRILQSLHAAVRRLEESGPAGLHGHEGLGAEEFGKLLDYYRVSVTYVTSLVDFGKLSRSMHTQINESLRKNGMRELVVKELSGDTPHGEIRAIHDDILSGGETEAVVSTSMIAHGIDVERLNLMVFNGMPKSMAEYIQASSRVGRGVLGAVFMIFNPIRERDRSHFRYHSKFHEYLDRMVEPVAINRWSRYALRKTLPGILMAQILQEVNRVWWNAGKAPAHLHDLVNMQAALRPADRGGLPAAQAEALLEVLTQVYLADCDEGLELRKELEALIPAALTSIRAAGAAAGASVGGRSTYRGTADYLGLQHSPMTSLRDVAEGIPFFVLSDRRRP